MKCQEVIELMQRYLDRDLSESEEHIMREHLRQCPDCSVMFERLNQVSNNLENLPKVTPPYSIVETVLPKLQEIDEQQGNVTNFPVREELVDGDRTGFFQKLQRKINYKIAGSVVAAGIILGIFITNMHPMERKDASSIAQSKMIAMNTEKQTATASKVAPKATAMAPHNAAHSSTVTSSSGVFSNNAIAPDTLQSNTKFDATTNATTTTSTNQPVIAESSTVDQYGPEVSVSSNLPSLDGAYNANIQNQRVIIKNTKGETVFTSSKQWKKDDQLHLVKWNKENQLFYDIISSSGTTLHFMIDVKGKYEKMVTP